MRWLALSILLCVAAMAQEAVKTAAGDPETHMVLRRAQIDVVVDTSRDLANPLTAGLADLQIKYLPSGKTVPVSEVDPSSLHIVIGTAREFVFTLTHESSALPESGDKSYELEVRNVAYAGSSSRTVIKATGTVYDAANIKALVDSTSEALSSAKTTEEKNLFAGFNVAVPSKGGGGVQADLVFNQSVGSMSRKLSRFGFADSGSFGAKLKKGAVLGNDPRQFAIGFNLRKTFLFASRRELNILRTATGPGAANVPSDATLRALSNVRSRFWRAFLVDYGFQMEADVSDRGVGNVSNAVFDGRTQLATAAWPFLRDKGYLTLRVMPAGVEAGHNLTNADHATTELGSILRYKAGAELRLFYQSRTDKALINRVELSGTSIYRRLLRNESAFDASTRSNADTTTGQKLWTQADFKVFAGPKLGKIRAGVKVTYQRGYLPPVFSRTNSLLYGLVFESSDGHTN